MFGWPDPKAEDRCQAAERRVQVEHKAGVTLQARRSTVRRGNPLWVETSTTALPPVLYRLVRSPDEPDYESNAREVERGLKPQPRRPLSADEQRLWAGVSVIESIQKARALSESSPKLPKFVATLDSTALPNDVTFEPIDEGHFNLYGEPSSIGAAEVGKRIHVSDIPK